MIKWIPVTHGGSGSGNFDHCGRKGERGGSAVCGSGGHSLTADSLRSQLPLDKYGKPKGTKDLGEIEIAAHRVGPVKDTQGRGGIFFSGDETGTASYVTLHDGHVAKSYTIKFKNALLAGHQGDITEKFFSRSYGDVMDQVVYKSKGVGSSAKFDKKMLAAAKKAGYDGIIFVNPAPPASTEIVIIGKPKSRLIENKRNNQMTQWKSVAPAIVTHGGKGSGNFGHCGREGEQGGSSSDCGGGGKTKKSPVAKIMPAGTRGHGETFEWYKHGGRAGKNTIARTVEKAKAMGFVEKRIDDTSSPDGGMIGGYITYEHPDGHVLKTHHGWGVTKDSNSFRMTLKLAEKKTENSEWQPVTHGGRGSGFYGHKGRPGERGGSSDDGGGDAFSQAHGKSMDKARAEVERRKSSPARSIDHHIREMSKRHSLLPHEQLAIKAFMDGPQSDADWEALSPEAQAAVGDIDNLMKSNPEQFLKDDMDVPLTDEVNPHDYHTSESSRHMQLAGEAQKQGDSKTAQHHLGMSQQHSDEAARLTQSGKGPSAIQRPSGGTERDVPTAVPAGEPRQKTAYGQQGYVRGDDPEGEQAFARGFKKGDDAYRAGLSGSDRAHDKKADKAWEKTAKVAEKDIESLGSGEEGSAGQHKAEGGHSKAGPATTATTTRSDLQRAVAQAKAAGVKGVTGRIVSDQGGRVSVELEGDEEAVGRLMQYLGQGQPAQNSKWVPITHGGSGSGNFGHAGRPGERGGSTSGGFREGQKVRISSTSKDVGMGSQKKKPTAGLYKTGTVVSMDSSGKQIRVRHHEDETADVYDAADLSDYDETRQQIAEHGHFQMDVGGEVRAFPYGVESKGIPVRDLRRKKSSGLLSDEGADELAHVRKQLRAYRKKGVRSGKSYDNLRARFKKLNRRQQGLS